MSVSQRRFASSVMPLSAFVDELDIGKQQIEDEANPDLGHDGVVPRKFLILRFCLIHLKKSSICHRSLPVDFRDERGYEHEVVGQELIRFSLVVHEFNASELASFF